MSSVRLQPLRNCEEIAPRGGAPTHAGAGLQGGIATPWRETSLQPLTVVSADVPRDVSDALLDALGEQGFAPVSWDDVERAGSCVSLFLEDATAADDTCHALAAVGRTLGLELRPTVATLPPQDWAESWKRFFRVEHVGARVVVRPPWEPYQPRPGECVIDLDPGMSFGTGRHGTTQACLAFLDRMAAADAARSVLDMGCGSGILAIAARKLGFVRVAGFDSDADAVTNAQENAARNGVDDIAWQVCDLAANAAAADVVVANILAPVLIEHAARIAAAVKPGARGALILSGILDNQYAGVCAAFAAQGFDERESLLLDEWRSGCFSRRMSPAVPPAPPGRRK